MAITAATLTTTVSESITLNGQTFGNTVTKTHASVKDLLTRTIVVPHGSTITSLYTVSTTEGGSAFSPTDLKYVRITNTDTTNFTKFLINISLLIVPNLNHNLFLDILKMPAHPNNYTIL